MSDQLVQDALLLWTAHDISGCEKVRQGDVVHRVYLAGASRYGSKSGWLGLGSDGDNMRLPATPVAGEDDAFVANVLDTV